MGGHGHAALIIWGRSRSGRKDTRDTLANSTYLMIIRWGEQFGIYIKHLSPDGCAVGTQRGGWWAVWWEALSGRSLTHATLQAAEANASAPSVVLNCMVSLQCQAGLVGWWHKSGNLRRRLAAYRLAFSVAHISSPTPSISIHLLDLLLSLTQPRQPRDDSSHTVEAHCEDAPLCPSLAVCCWFASGRLRFLG